MKATLCLAIIAVCLLTLPAFAANPTPKISIISPEAGLTIATQMVAVEVSYAAAGKALVEQVELAIDGVIVDARVLDPAKAKGRASFTWIARNYADGEHTIMIRAVDSNAEVGEAEITVTLRGAQRSIIRVTSPKPGESVSSSTTIQVEADPTLARYVIFLVDDVFKAMSNVRPFTYVWDTTRYLNGKHVLQARAYLADDSEVSSSTVEVNVNNPSGATTMRATEPASKPAVAPAPLAPPARAAESIMPPPMHTESPSASAPPLTISQPDLAIPGTAPFVSASGELIQPPIPALTVSSPAPTPAPLEIAALPTPLETAPIIAAPVVAAPSPLRTPEGVISSAIAPDALVAETTQPTAAPLEVALLETPAPETSAIPPAEVIPAEVIPAEVSLAPAPAAEALPAEVAPPAASELKLAMLPPTPIELKPAPRVAAEPAPSPVIYTVRERGSLTRLAAEVGLPADEIARANNLTGVSLQAGQRLVLPSTPIYFDRQPLTADAPTVIAAGRAIAPLRAVIEQAGGQVKWDAAARCASARARGHEIAVTIGSDQAQVDGGLVTMAAVAELRCDRTVVPLRFLGDALDLVLQYEGGIIHLASVK